MSELSAVHIPLAIWGFLVGFVGWGSCFRLVEPIADWLVTVHGRAPVATAITRIVVAVFLIFAIITATAMLPAIIMAVDESTVRDNAYWRNLFGVALVSSLVGFFSWGYLQRFAGNDSQ